ncbi:MAG TPA: aldo/keto reductase [Acidimicrobiales bacterium]|jgi:aryl-alcohol dehydrogenase-like predicted oxidoreductase|nr:aldo/keto reductase [Acidimicrobiales bacterium]
MIERRPLGRTGVQVTALCLGAMNFGGPADEETSEKLLLTALDSGINFVDTADVYTGGESERIVGDVLARSGRRDDIVLATKVGLPSGPDRNERGASRRHIVRSCETSLRRLRTDHIDLYQLHRPSFDIDPEETLRAFDDLVNAGKVVNIGCSTHPAWYVRECLAVSDHHGWVRYTSEQPPYNLLDRRVENELVPLALRHGLALLPWSPLAGGILAGRYKSAGKPPKGSRAERMAGLRQRVTKKAIAAANTVGRLAEDRDMTPGQLALLWLRDRPGVTSPIVGPRTVEHLEESLAVADHAPLDADAVATIDELVPPGGFVSDFHNTSGWMAGSSSLS